MFPGQQGATCPAQIWPPRLAIKLLDGATSREKWRFEWLFLDRVIKKAVALAISPNPLAFAVRYTRTAAS